uniref:Uncharacterized protein n=1 Tax=Amphimedon queenslandica TaxID=400682 RepID=A0A1X7UKF3_AMPQE
MASRFYHAGLRFTTHNSFRMQTILSLNRNLRNTASNALFLRRTKTNNIPAYHNYKSGGTRTLTILKKIDGDTEVSIGGRRVQLFDADAAQDDEDI